jgi:ABC-2 type transport system ATP-binding protein
VLHGLTFDVPRGSIVGVLGPSGCGKTTLMRALVGVQIVRSGAVTVLGEPAGSPGLRRRVGYATQTPAVYADLTVAENLRYFASVLGAPRADVARVIDEVGLGRSRDQTAATLSGGQLSRANLAVALLGEPELLVLDEPTVGLDPVLRQELWELFRELAERGATLVVSSHVMDEAGRTDRLLLMREGDVLADGTPESLRSRTGASDLEEAFLHLIHEKAGSPS